MKKAKFISLMLFGLVFASPANSEEPDILQWEFAKLFDFMKIAKACEQAGNIRCEVHYYKYALVFGQVKGNDLVDTTFKFALKTLVYTDDHPNESDTIFFRTNVDSALLLSQILWYEGTATEALLFSKLAESIEATGYCPERQKHLDRIEELDNNFLDWQDRFLYNESALSGALQYAHKAYETISECEYSGGPTGYRVK